MKLVPMGSTPLCVLLLVLATSAQSSAASFQEAFPAATPESQGLRTEGLQVLADEIQGYVDKNTIVGAELLVIKNRRTVWHEAFGLRDVKNDIPMERDSIFNIRSMTKPITGAAMQILIDQGEADPNDRVGDLLSAFDNEQSGEITIFHLLTHRSGLPLTILTTSVDQYPTLFDMACAAGEKGVQFPTDQKFWYSDIGTDTLGALVEELSGERLDEFVGSRLLEPLGMTDSLYVGDEPDPRRERIGVLYIGGPGKWREFTRPGETPLYPCPWGSQSLFSTAKDYAKFLAMWMDDGKVGEEEILSPEAIRRTLTPVSPMSQLGSDAPFPTGFAGLKTFYGQMSVLYVDPEAPEDKLPEVIGHSGSDGTWAFAWPERDLMVLYFTQSRGQITGLRLERTIDQQLLRAEGETASTEVPEQYRPLVGTYLANFGPFRNEAFEVLMWDGALALDIPSQIVVELEESTDEGRWYFPSTRQVWIEFERGDDGQATWLIFNEGSNRMRSPREGSDYLVEVEPETLKEYVGRYRNQQRDLTATVLLESGHLCVDWPGETVYPLYPPDEHGVWTLVASKGWTVTFEKDDDGAITSMTYRQGGAVIEMTRLPDA